MRWRPASPWRSCLCTWWARLNIVGMIVAGVVGYFAIQLVKLLADKGKFGRFAYYCWIVGAVALVASFVIL